MITDVKAKNFLIFINRHANASVNLVTTLGANGTTTSGGLSTTSPIPLIDNGLTRIAGYLQLTLYDAKNNASIPITLEVQDCPDLPSKFNFRSGPYLRLKVDYPKSIRFTKLQFMIQLPKMYIFLGVITMIHLYLILI